VIVGRHRGWFLAEEIDSEDAARQHVFLGGQQRLGLRGLSLRWFSFLLEPTL